MKHIEDPYNLFGADAYVCHGSMPSRRILAPSSASV